MKITQFQFDSPTNRHCRNPRRKLVVAIALLILLAVFRLLIGHRLVILNTSTSVSRGLYVRCSERPAVGKLVDFRIPFAGRSYLANRSNLDVSNWYILKPIAAGPGDHLDTTGNRLVINGIDRGPMTTLDSNGKALPVWRASRTLKLGEYFVFSGEVPRSLDGRHFGPIHHSEIDSVRQPWIVW